MIIKLLTVTMAAAFTLTACSASSESSVDVSASPDSEVAVSEDPAGEDSPAAVAAAGAPEVGQCWQMPLFTAFVFSDADKRDCSDEHTAVTVAVQQFPDGETVNPFSTLQQILDRYPDPETANPTDEDIAAFQEMAALPWLTEQVDACSAAINDYIKAPELPFGQIGVAAYPSITGPSAEQWDAGDRWIRCDMALPDPSVSSAEPAWVTLPEDVAGVAAGPELVNFLMCQSDGGADAPFSMCDGTDGDASALLVRSVSIPAEDTPWVDLTTAVTAGQDACAASVSELSSADAEQITVSWIAVDPTGTTTLIDPDGETAAGDLQAAWEAGGLTVSCSVPANTINQ